MFQPRLGVSLHTIATDLTPDLMRALAGSQIATLEVSARLFADAAVRRAALPLLQELVRGSGIRVATIHAQFGQVYDLSSPVEETQRAAHATLRAAIELAVALDAQTVVLHASAEPIAPSERAQRLAQARATLGDVVAWCAAAGRRAAIELLPRTCLGNRVEELAALLDGLDGAVLGVCLDTNHLMDRPQDLAQTVRTLDETLIALHMSDYDGIDEQHALPGTGVLDWASFLQALREIDYQGPFNYECGIPGDSVAARIAALEENYRWLSAL
ncbi:MAG: sugar phosphate isomerase/epimerase [Anaerolineae bacterium]|nr:sugar phosphate isomerase/epimerase [Anaerolineae bacterium]